MHINLSGKKCLVTGASRGIGYAIGKQLLESGAEVVLQHFRHSEDLIELQRQYPSTARKVKTDLSDLNQSKALVSKAIAALNGLDVLVNNAGVCIPADTKSDKWDAVWEKTMSVNTRAVGVTCKDAINHFVNNGGGHIVNISSRAAFRGDTDSYMAYAASKGAVVSLTRTIARSYGKQGIKAFDIAPGFVKTDMAQAFIDTYGDDYVRNDLALNALTVPEDLAPTVAFLVSGKADHLTGTTIDINAGSYMH